MSSYAPLLDSLIRSGECVLYLDFRRRSLSDLSIYHNDGVPTLTTWAAGGVDFLTNGPPTGSKVTVPDSPEIRLTEGSLVVLSPMFLHQVTTESLFFKRGAGTNYQFDLQTGNLRFYDGTNIRLLATSVIGKRYLACNFKDTETPEGFVDGLSVGAFSDVVSISTTTDDLLIGNQAHSSRLFSLLEAALVINRELTEQEHSQLYAELLSIVWPR